MSEPNTITTTIEEVIVEEKEMPQEMPEPLTVEQRLEALEKELAESKKREAEKDAKIEQLWNLVMEGQINVKSNGSASEQSKTIKVVEEKTEFVRYWKCDSYNNSYNSMYTKFTSNPHVSFMKQDLKEEWMATNPRNKGQWEVTLKRLVEYEFIEEGRDGRFKTYKLCEGEIQAQRNYLKRLVRINTAGTARLA